METEDAALETVDTALETEDAALEAVDTALEAVDAAREREDARVEMVDMAPDRGFDSPGCAEGAAVAVDAGPFCPLSPFGPLGATQGTEGTQRTKGTQGTGSLDNGSFLAMTAWEPLCGSRGYECPAPMAPRTFLSLNHQHSTLN